MKLIFRYIQKHILIFAFSMLFLTMEAVADLLQPTLMSMIVDNGITNADISLIIKYGIIMLLIAFVGAFSAIMRNKFASTTSQTIAKEIRSDLYAKVHTLSFENIDKLHPASIITRMTNDVTQVQEFINGLMRIMVKAPITCIGAIVLIIIRTPKQAPIIAIILVIVSILILGNIKFGYPKFGIVQKKLDGLNSTSREFLSSVRVVKAFSAEDAEEAKFVESSQELALANTEALRVMAVFAPLISLTVNFGIIILLWISKSQSSEQIGKLMASVNYMTQVLFGVTMISNMINVAVRSIASSKRINEIFNEKPAQVKAENAQAIDIHGTITFDNVSFKYAKSSIESLSNITFEVKSGSTIGIIGPTGSGKSTLINLIPRFYDATSGKVLIDNVDVNTIEEHCLRNAISLVPQKSLLFSGSIKDNLLWGDENATDEEIEHVAKIACVHDFIMSTSDGYNTLLGQGGVNLSGGQKQRLSIARALLKKPKILILDDCTSALDSKTEKTVLEGIREYAKDATVIIISQRISTVMKSDSILCIDNGEIQGHGTHNELLDSCATYRNIYISQIGGEPNGK
ncbi:MAG: ABC transporter ATP-binding protein/permease [Clostridia bacterium]|nr:ABC transporter ATP-binding protein/permease [Clostridia bacterium]